VATDKRLADRERREELKEVRKKKKRKVCAFCVEHSPGPDWKDVSRLRKFISDRAKILPRRVTGNCALHQRRVAQAVKRARIMALLPFVSE